jgi:antitoxin VapB
MHFGPPDEELRKVFEAGGKVMASMLHATRPGHTFRQVLQANEQAYAEAGYADEWQRHLQGGPILTGERITLLRNLPDAAIKSGMALAYNPTCRGSKHEDTFIVTADGIEILTPCLNWPTRTYVIEGKEYTVPDLKIVE